ncbi:hypothetical protein DL764_007295 [Monosporascus ibericus]|uniref:Xylanolytic transcriptional activator regulatory domain-containing protein n=1 Tax=Monosporascus ibericus TaxID=155417 RepID=A0A4Q4T1Y7_9PEZI|nr:hypothetical protein DL764_007295 [Monosporascus ibericus]
MIPPRAESDLLVQAYLRTFQTVFGILSVSSFCASYKHFWGNPVTASDKFLTTLLLVMSLGSIFCSREIAIERTTVLRWIHSASTWIHSPKDTDQLDLDDIRIQCLFLLTRQARDGNDDKCWLSSDSLVRMAMLLGLHFDPAKHGLPDIPSSEIEARRRLWATVLELEVQSSMDHGSCPSVDSEHYDCAAPSNVDDADAGGNVSAPKPENQLTQSSIQILLMRSIRTRLRVARFLNTLQSDMPFDTALSLSSELAESLKGCTNILEAYRMSTSPPTAFQTKLYDLLTRRFLLGLHHPFAVMAMKDPSYYYSRKVCIETSLFLCSQTTLSGDEDFQRLRLSGSGFFHNPYTQSVLYMCSELIDQAEVGGPLSTSPQETSLYKDVRVAAEFYMDLALGRIKSGERSIQCYLAVCCLLAQVDAVKARTAIEPRISEALGKHLEKYHGCLMGRVQEAPELTDWEPYDSPSKPSTGDETIDWSMWDEHMTNGSVDQSWGPSVLTPPNGRWRSQGLLHDFGAESGYRQ